MVEEITHPATAVSVLPAGAGAGDVSVSITEVGNNRLDDIAVEDPPHPLKNLDFFGLLPVGVFLLLFSVSMASCADLLSRGKFAVVCCSIPFPYDVLLFDVVFLSSLFADNGLFLPSVVVLPPSFLAPMTELLLLYSASSY